MCACAKDVSVVSVVCVLSVLCVCVCAKDVSLASVGLCTEGCLCVWWGYVHV